MTIPSDSPRVLVTGPVDRTEEYAAAARGAGFEAIVCELLAVRARTLDRAALPARLDLVCATSKHALHALETFAHVPAAVVGDETATLLRERGFELVLPPARSAVELARALAAHFSAHSRRATVFWPRGSLSDELGRDLRESGFTVFDPIVYETLEVADLVLPRADVVFLASPSAVRAFSAVDGRAATGLAVGATTAQAMRKASERFAAILTLERPTPEAFARALRDLAGRDGAA